MTVRFWAITVERCPELSCTTLRWTGRAPNFASRLFPVALSGIEIVTFCPAGIVSLEEPTVTASERVPGWRRADTATNLP